MWQTPAWDRHEQTYNFHTCNSPRIATSLHGLKHILKHANAVSCFVFEISVLKPAVVTGIQFSSVSPGNCWDITLQYTASFPVRTAHASCHTTLRNPCSWKALLNNRNIEQSINQTLIGAASHTIAKISYTSPAVALISYSCQCTIRANKCSMVHENKTNELKTSKNSRQANHDCPVLQRVQVGSETKPQSNGYKGLFSQKCSGLGVSWQLTSIRRSS